MSWLLDAARELLAAWDQEDELELNDLSDDLWHAVSELRRAADGVEE